MIAQKNIVVEVNLKERHEKCNEQNKNRMQL